MWLYNGASLFKSLLLDMATKIKEVIADLTGEKLSCVIHGQVVKAMEQHRYLGIGIDKRVFCGKGLPERAIPDCRVKSVSRKIAGIVSNDLY